MGFHYEKELPHQMAAINAVLAVFNGASKNENAAGENPSLSFSGNLYQRNIQSVQSQNRIEKTADLSNILDISMETGTGKTYTYTQTMYEMHRWLGVYKFVIVVPTLSIKAGAENFLKSKALKTHFKSDFEDNRYGEAEIQLYVVQSQKAKKGKRSSAIPDEIVRFVQADERKKIHVLLLNMGMVNSKTMRGEDAGNDGSVLLKDLYAKPFEAIASVNPILIIDEPHRFDGNNKTWKALQDFKPQYILRYGATFNDKFSNLLYRLSAIDAFNQDLVKGVSAHIQEVQGEKASKIRFIESDGTNASFEFEKRTFTLNKGESLHKIYAHIHDLSLESLNRSTAVLSNGVELKKGEGIYPFSYSDTVFEQMIRQAVKTHFENEKQLLDRPDKIKPLTLFFIDDIAGYRDGNGISGSLKSRFEQIVKAEAQKALENAPLDTAFYQSLQTVLADVSATHGGYFSKDNSSDDEKIAQEINEILHDKESLLSLDNPRRFIFSKWTLREGWDNPNVFGICKLRSSGSETSKLQEVGRGLRLPVNEFMSRVKNGDFKLHYFVDSSESDFVESLKAEINQAQQTDIIYEKWNDELFEKIKSAYPEVKKRPLGNELYDLEFIDDNDDFINDGFAKLKEKFPLAFHQTQLKKGKIINAKEKTKVAVRTGKYAELKALWELINQKAILQYNIDETQMLELFKDFLLKNKAKFTETGISVKTQEMVKTHHQWIDFKTVESAENIIFEPLVTLNYREFLQKLAVKSYLKQATLHQAFFAVKDEIDIARFLNEETIHFIHAAFKEYLLHHSISQFDVAYQKISSQIHPSKLTDRQGKPLSEIEINQDWGVINDEKIPLESFLFDKVFSDSAIECENITESEVQEVVVFTKIPKNAIKIPVAGGETYSPDFAYIVKTSSGETLHLVVESKGIANKENLRQREWQKIQHAERWFNAIADTSTVKLTFKTQFKSEKMIDIIEQALR
ncbi:type III restriction-modification system endonuclease [Rodentibacter trehalosifermentans]|uniref:type III restriction-modification system endonuclease n=1 Tax=Rodentibacter trehalosifermentans TaxID=1908263 RepID=UPI00098494EE|nr:type III restriction-modification system endonuclease [Rodentibacter trehalosifermentans]OOF47866.1 restriction endonuclease subunit R [Rodentibacter trehalosifermentans]